MNRRQPQKSLFWYLLLLSLGLHGLVMWVPIASDQPAVKPQSSSVKRVPLSTQPIPLAVLPKPSPTKSPAVAPIAKPLPKPLVARATPSAVQPILTPASPTPTSAPTPTPSAVQPTPTPGPDVFQVKGAIACDGVKDCYASAETNGREVSQTLEQKLQTQGYVLERLEVNDDTGMTIYHLFQNGKPKDYLHIIWTDQGTRSLRLPKPVTDRQKLAAIARLDTSSF